MTIRDLTEHELDAVSGGGSQTIPGLLPFKPSPEPEIPPLPGVFPGLV